MKVAVESSAVATNSVPQQFCTQDLPENSRVVKPGSKMSRDHVEDRLNVHVDADNKVTHVTLG